jgi:ribosomal protein L3 glutamine methyltransferase
VLEAAYPSLSFMWMETQSGDGFVFLLTREDLVAAGLGDPLNDADFGDLVIEDEDI